MAGEEKMKSKAPQEKGAEPGASAKDPKMLALSWLTSFIAGSAAYYILKHDAIGSVAVAAVVATVLVLVKWKMR